MSVEIRSPSEDELRQAMKAVEAAFGEEQKEEDLDRHQKAMPRDRFLVAYDGAIPVGTTASLPFELTVPGGAVAAGGVTWVGVLPSHRRRGILTQMMKRQLDDLRERGEPLAILWASEAAIYGRFGYGISAPTVQLDADRSRFSLRDDPGPKGAVRLIDREEAARVLPPIYDAVRARVPGFTSRSELLWDLYRLADPEHWRRGAGPKFYAVLEFDGEPVGYALYRIKLDWQEGFAKSQVKVVETCATSDAAERELWRFLFGIDLIERIQGRHDPGSPLFLMVVDPRSLKLRVTEGLWLRLVDLDAALTGRTYATDDSVVMDVRDELCPWNAGRWRMGTDAGRTDDDVELELDVADLASAYLGAFDFGRLAAAQRVRELKSGALGRATELFRTSRPPFCPEDF
ncbi:MAG: GNAT family N-acetyltransferase [Actinobacteria bacterium]|nr:MAG: GNAT family N-acetyltransferase [Actinomycetota bacterium]TML89721.1 MAG: GNAT family N-acetyltransferase [Actinomycetota bacterium]